MKKLLFISHDDSITGAPILLLNLAKVLTLNIPDLEIDFLVKKNSNQLIKKIKSVAKKTYILNERSKTSFHERLINKLQRTFLGDLNKQRLFKINFERYDLIFSNTITNGDVLEYIRKRFSGRIISYIHELEIAGKLYTSETMIKNVLTCSHHFAVPSLAVQTFLGSKYNISNQDISLLPYYIENTNIQVTNERKKNQSAVFCVGGCGTMDWRKGIDLFIQVAYSYKSTYGDDHIKFIWKGAYEDLSKEMALYDSKKSGLNQDYIEFLSADSEMNFFWNNLELFLLTSREDPYPLVVLEAASHKIPSIGFKDAGGAEEFIKNDAGSIVSYLSVLEMVQTIKKYYDNIELIQNHGNTAYARYLLKHNNMDLVCKTFLSIANLD